MNNSFKSWWVAILVAGSRWGGSQGGVLAYPKITDLGLAQRGDGPGPLLHPIQPNGCLSGIYITLPHGSGYISILYIYWCCPPRYLEGSGIN